MRSRFHLFAYGTLRPDGDAAGLLTDCERVCPAEVEGTLYGIDGEYPALVLAGTGRVQGEILRCPVELLPELDRYEGVAAGLFRRVARRIDGVACWTYVAGPALSVRLRGARRLTDGRWPGADAVEL